jgi:nitroreductase
MKKKWMLVVLLYVFMTPGVIISQDGRENKGTYPNDTVRVIHSRKSVRHFVDKPISKEDLMVILKAGMAAPTARNQQPWAFVVITDKEVRTKLAEGLPYTKMVKDASAAIIVCGVMAKALQGEEQSFWIQDCSAATENILLAAESLGLGAVWSGMYPLEGRMKYVREVLKIPEDVVPLNVIPIGYPAGDENPKDKFNPATIHWEKW